MLGSGRDGGILRGLAAKTMIRVSQVPQRRMTNKKAM